MEEFPISIGKKRGNRASSIAVNILLVILIIIIVLELTFFSRFKRFYVVGESMYPTLIGAKHNGDIIVAGGDYVYADTMAEPQRFDIVVITTDDKYGKQTTIIKRVIAFGGESVELVEGLVYIDGQLIEESYVSPECMTPQLDINNRASETVPDGCIYVLGDNRDVSNDSRGDYGMIDLDDVVGVVESWSLDIRWLVNPISSFFEFTLPGMFSGCGSQ